jgi:signal transduction histidine kinase
VAQGKRLGIAAHVVPHAAGYGKPRLRVFEPKTGVHATFLGRNWRLSYAPAVQFLEACTPAGEPLEIEDPKFADRMLERARSYAFEQFRWAYIIVRGFVTVVHLQRAYVTDDFRWQAIVSSALGLFVIALLAFTPRTRAPQVLPIALAAGIIAEGAAIFFVGPTLGSAAAHLWFSVVAAIYFGLRPAMLCASVSSATYLAAALVNRAQGHAGIAFEDGTILATEIFYRTLLVYFVAALLTIFTIRSLRFGFTQVANAASRHARGQRVALERLERMQRYEHIGRLAAGQVHDANNALAVVVGSIDLLRETPNLSREDLEVSLNEMSQAVGRVTQSMRQLLRYSQGEQRPTLERVAAADLVRNFGRWIVKTLPETMHCEIDIRSSAITKLDRFAVEQALLNLCLNARDAMASQGKLKISVVDSDDDRVQIVVEDNGPGLEPEVAVHIFEPFFTTKSSSGGTGLGLTMVKHAVENSDGSIDFQSTLHVGTKFVLSFPRENAQVLAQSQRESFERPEILIVGEHSPLAARVAEVVADLGLTYQMVATVRPQASLTESSLVFCCGSQGQSAHEVFARVRDTIVATAGPSFVLVGSRSTQNASAAPSESELYELLSEEPSREEILHRIVALLARRAA